MKWELHFNVWLPPAPHKKRKAHHNMFKGYFLWIGDVSLAWETHQEFISDEVLGPYKIFILTGLHTNWKKQTQTWWFATKREKSCNSNCLWETVLECWHNIAAQQGPLVNYWISMAAILYMETRYRQKRWEYYPKTLEEITKNVTNEIP